MSSLPYSYHTFIFPFVWNNGGTTSLDDFNQCIDEEYWKPCDWEDGKIPPYRGKNEDDDINKRARDKFFTDYQAYQYFMPNARNLLYHCDATEPVVNNYDFTIKGEPLVIESSEGKCVSNAKYIIIKRTENNNIWHFTKYTLQINAIRMRIFNSGVGILKLETEFHGDKELDGKIVDYTKTGTKERVFDFNAINEYGRRINLPYIGDMKEGQEYPAHALVADSVEVWLKDGDVELKEDFTKTIIRMNSEENPFKMDKTLSLTYIGKHIKNLIDIGNGRGVTSKRDGNTRDDIYIYPIIDDRMYVCAMMRNNIVSENIKIKNENDDDYAIYSDNELSQTIYKMGFIENGCSCQSSVMRHDILKRCVYDRWIDWGTIDIITHHSTVRITGEDEDIVASVINPFLLQYIQMAEIALVQRATILALFDRIDNATAGISKKSIDESAYRKIREIQRDYVKAQNQIFLGDVTVQEQGVEEFRMMLDELYLDRTTQELDEQIKDAFALATDYVDRSTNKRLNFITVVGAFFAVVTIIFDFITGLTSEAKPVFIIVAGLAGIVGISAYVGYLLKKRKDLKKWS